jgi:uncharacterized protein YjgD (DUF1641 family)
MTPEAVAIADTPPRTQDIQSVATALQTMEERTRAVAELADGLRPLIALAGQAPALVAVLMDSFDEAMRMASDRGIDVERGLLNGAEAALRFGTTMDAERVRDLDALLKSGVFAPSALRVIGELGRALTDTAAAPPATYGIVGLLKALGQPDVQRALGFLVTFAERFGRRLRELPAVQG